MKTWVLAIASLIGWLLPTTLNAQAPPRGKADAELRAHLNALGQRLDDLSTDLGVRERLALEMATTLDRAALSSPAPEVRRAYWSEASEILDRFREKNPGHLQSLAFQIQASVYVWAQARSWMQAYKANPLDTKARQEAVAELEACVNRLRPVREAIGEANDVLAQNARFRLAQALADLAEFESDEPSTTRSRNNEALLALKPTMSEPSLQGFSHHLRALLLARLGRFDEAKTEIALAAKANPPVPEAEAIQARLAVLLGMHDFSDALKTVDAARLSPGEKTAHRLHVRLTQRMATPQGKERDDTETALFHELNVLRTSSRPETRAALLAVAEALNEPGARQEPIAWDLLAEGAMAQGDPSRAGMLERRAAEKAESLGKSDEARSYRLRAGAYLYQGEKFAEADPLLEQVASDARGGADRVRAGLLLALARGRALALGRPGASQAAYSRALRDQIKNFPDDPSASEARWLLGKLLLAEADRAGALSLWEAIPHGSPRWVESRVEIATLRQHDLDNLRLKNDRDAVNRSMNEARAALAKCLEQAKGDNETNEILLAISRLELTPNVGRPEVVQANWERFQHSAAQPSQRDNARRLNIVALAELSRWVEAEQAARQEIKLSQPVDLFPLIRLLDRLAAESESDLRTRRVGYLLRILINRLLDHPETLTPELLAEAQLRNVRALLFSGDDRVARRIMSTWSSSPASKNLDLLRDLAETYTQLEAYELAVDVQRLRSKLVPTGSLPWFDARYGLALAYYRAGHPKSALHLIDATTILHPELGGGDLRDRFIRLRQRIEPVE